MIAVGAWAIITVLMFAWLAYDTFKNRSVEKQLAISSDFIEDKENEKLYVYYKISTDTITLSVVHPNKLILKNYVYLGPL